MSSLKTHGTFLGSRCTAAAKQNLQLLVVIPLSSQNFLKALSSFSPAAKTQSLDWANVSHLPPVPLTLKEDARAARKEQRPEKQTGTISFSTAQLTDRNKMRKPTQKKTNKNLTNAHEEATPAGTSWFCPDFGPWVCSCSRCLPNRDGC